MAADLTPPPGDPRDDIVDDRAIKDAALDEFGHAEFAEQAARTIRAVEPPTNIAIYAPWGSGKSSLANLIKIELTETECGFIYFDAFKYAEAPLRREFIRNIAKALQVKDEEFDRGLYEEQVTSGLNLTKASIKSLAKAIGIVAGTGGAIALIAAWILAFVSGKEVRPTFASNAIQLLPLFFAPSLLVGPFFALIGAHLNVTRKRFAPESDEEFERLFRRLVERALTDNKKWTRIVVFVDELDRCAADEVASTLETLRTFLEVDDCVFVVAADRQVLERAAAREARQETPYDPRNPYYSVGSSYLDKIFQHQWHLPPMMPSSLARFAQGLIAGRSAGVWAEIDAGLVASVLVPVHVQSPRRVKELLNTFSMTYRVAQGRVRAGQLDCDLRERAAELAKLVCLQLEFPAFAADLKNEPRLPELVLRLHEEKDPKRPGDVAADIWERARAYALGQLELDVVMSAGPTVSGPDGAAEEPDEGSAGPQAAVIAAQGHLLVRYLLKTRRVAGPEADLIYLEGLGFAVGLPTALAVRLKASATEGLKDEAVSLIETLPVDQQLAATRLLAVVVREALPGLEGENALGTLLGVVGALPELDLGPVVDELADAVNGAIKDDNLPPDDVAGALRLGLATKRPIGKELVTNALQNTAVTEEHEVAAFVSTCINQLAEQDVDMARVGEVVASLIVRLDWPSAAETVVQWTDATVAKLLPLVRAPMLAFIDDPSFAEDSDEEESQDTAEQEAAVTEGADEEQPSTAANALGELGRVITAAVEADRKTLAEELLELTLSIDAAEARTLVAQHLPAVTTVSSPSLSRAVLVQCRKRKLPELTTWIAALDPNIATSLEGAAELVATAMPSAWGHAVEAAERSALEHVHQLTAVATRLASTLEWDRAALAAAITTSASAAGIDEATAKKWLIALSTAKALAKGGLLRPADWHPAFMAPVPRLLTETPPEASTQTWIKGFLIEDLPSIVQGSTIEARVAIDAAISSSPWLTTQTKHLVRLRLTAARRAAGETLDSPVSDQELNDAIEAVANDEDQFAIEAAIGAWLNIGPSVDVAWNVLVAYAPETISETVLGDLRRWADGLGPSGRTDVAAHALRHFPDTVPSESFLEAIGFSRGDLAASVALIVDAFARVSNEDHRRAVLRLWHALHLTHRELNRELVGKVLLPLIRHGKTSRDLILQNLDLVQAMPKADRKRVATTFEEATKDREWDIARKRLVEAGFMKTKGALFKREEHLDD